MSRKKKGNRGGTGGDKTRVPMRRNRSKPARTTDWTRQAREQDGHEVDSPHSENVVAKGDLSRHRTMIKPDETGAGDPGTQLGTVIAMRGLFAEVDGGQGVVSCTVRRVLRTRSIEDRQPVTVGDRVRFRLEGDNAENQEGVIEAVEPRRGQLQRRVAKRIQTIVANVDQAIIVSSAGEPEPRPNLIDRYVASSMAGDIKPIICMNKIDLDASGSSRALLRRYAGLGLETICASAMGLIGIDELRECFRGKASVVAGQSGVGKSSLLNAVQPGLKLRTGGIINETGKGRHTTTTASLIPLDIGGYVVDTPGVRSFDLSVIPQHEIEMYFVEFLPHIPHCKFPDCTHTHEIACAVKTAVESGEIHPERYESYVRLFAGE
jgi:ribosome biogenesis GTPase